MKNPSPLGYAKLAFSALLTAALTSSASAAVITWGSVTNIAGDSDVVATGTTYQAWNFGTTTNTTVNGVTFTGWNPSGGASSITNGNSVISKVTGSGDPLLTGSYVTFGSGSAVAPYVGLGSDYKVLLGSSTFFSSVTSPNKVQLTFTGLTIDTPYLFQVWINDSRGGTGGAINQVFTGGPSLRGNTNAGTNPAAGGTGQFVTATFTADATSQRFEWTGNNFIYVTGAQLRVVPEPGSALAVVGGLAALAFRRRRSS